MRRFRCIAALLMAASLPGCLESNDNVVLRKDGTGVIVSRYTVDKAKTDEFVAQVVMMAQMMDPNMASQPAPKIEGDPLHPNWFRELAKATEGYDVTKAEQTVEENRRTTTVQATFTSLEAAARGHAFYAAVVRLERIEKTESCPTGSWRLTFDDLGAVRGMLPEGMDFDQARQSMAMLEPQLGGLAITRAITLPTKVIKTNGAKGEDGMTVNWDITFEKMLGSEPLTMEVEFEDSEGLALKPFTFAPRMSELQRRAATPPPGTEKKAAEEGSADDEDADDEDGEDDEDVEDDKDE